MSRKVHGVYDSASNVIPADPSSAPDFTASLGHLTSWMRLFGIPLGVASERSKWWRIWLASYTLAFLSVNVANNLAAICLYFSEYRNKPPDRGNRVVNWNTTLAIFNFSFTAIGMNITLVASTSVKWESLLAALRRIHASRTFQTVDHHKFNNRCMWGLAVCITLTLGVSLIAIIPLTTPHTAPVLERFVQAFKYIGLVQLYSFAVFFYILVSTATWMIAELERGCARQFAERKDERTLKEWIHLFDKLKSDYLVACNFVEQINRSFGATLLVVLASEFIRIVNSSFSLLENAEQLISFNSNELSTLGFLMSEIIFLLIIASRSHQVQAEVGNLLQQVWKFQISDPAVRALHHSLISEMSLFRPRVILMGFLELNLNILPTITGTTLTYLIILWQFQSSEKY